MTKKSTKTISRSRNRSKWPYLRFALKVLLASSIVGLIYMSSWLLVHDENNDVEKLVKAQHMYNKQQGNHSSWAEPSKIELGSTIYSNLSCAATQSLCFDKKMDSEDYENPFDIAMAAMPHTASTTTDKLLKARKKSWNVSLPLEQRGFTCPSSSQKIVVTPQLQTCHDGSSSRGAMSTDTNQQIYDCVLEKFTYKYKVHLNIDSLKSSGKEIIFTTLRKPGQTMLSHYKDRDQWDWTYEVLYPDDDLKTVPIERWIRKAWYRHNLFVKTFATDTKLIFRLQNESDIHPTKEESDYQISLGKDSPWLKTSIQRIKEMPFFGLFHRMDESFELFEFHLCIPMDSFKNRNNDERVGSDEYDDIIQKYFALDMLLLEEAEILFDDLILDMKKKKDHGMICDISKLLQKESNLNSLGLMCANDTLIT